MTAGRVLSPWRMVAGLGLVSLFADMVADGGKSLYGPLLASLGASALLIGIVSGAAEAMSLLLRLVSGPLADRAGAHWSWTLVGYGLTAVFVPLLAFTPALGAAGVVIASILIIGERAGKAIRSPSKTALLAHAAGAVGQGKGFAVHKALDLAGAFAGPLIAAGMLAWTGQLWPAFAVLIVPGAVTMVLLFWLQRRVPDPSVYDAVAEVPEDPSSTAPTPPQPGEWRRSLGAGLPREFFTFALATGLTTAGLVSYSLISLRFVQQGTVALWAVPLVFAGAMAAGAIAALANGWAYDRYGPKVLIVLPLLVAGVPLLAFADELAPVLVGMAFWGFASGLQDSTIKAMVADLVPAPRRATAYGIFAAIQGVAALAGGVLIGLLFDQALPLVLPVVVFLQLIALVLLLRVQLPRTD